MELVGAGIVVIVVGIGLAIMKWGQTEDQAQTGQGQKGQGQKGQGQKGQGQKGQGKKG